MELEQALARGEQSTGAQMVVAIFPSLEGESLEDYSIRLAERWRIGQKGLDNGVILLVFLQERRVRLEVGYGLEGAIPDAEAIRIIREAIAPRFRTGQYAAGLDAAVSAVYARVGSRAGPAGTREHARARSGSSTWAVLGFLGILVVIAIYLAREASSAQRFVRGNAYTAGRRGWSTPVIFPAPWIGGSRWGGGGGGGGGFSGGGGSFGGGGASGSW